ncbi:MAG: gliding motility-associated C-terminal domain-containing protein, partial [Gelidibacter sp.]
ITVENTGNVTLFGVGIVDTLTDINGNPLMLTTGPTFVSADQGSPESELMVGEIATYTASYIITQSDTDIGGVSNTVLASGNSPLGVNVTDVSDDPNDTENIDPDADGDPDDPTDTIILEVPRVEATKTASVTDNGDGVMGINDIITYTITVQNIGNVNLNGVGIVDTLTDANGNPLTLTTGPTFVSADQGSTEGNLMVGEIATYTATYIITQDDVDTGGVSNTVLANGNSPMGTNVTDDSDDGDDTDGNTDNDPTETITDSTFDLSITKVVDNTSPLVGDQVTFAITITNEGLVTATNIIVDEVLPSGYNYVSSLATEGIYSETNGTWTVAQLGPGEIEILEITVEVLGFGDYLNTASIGVSDGGVDVNTTNDSDDASVDPLCLTIYNEFSPNEDGVNEVFMIDCIERYPNNKLEVYNRWGNLVFEKQNYQNDWNGISNGRAVLNESDKLPVGTYYYVIDLGNGTKPRVGWLYINR